MKNLFENLNDLIEAAEKLSFPWSKVNENKVIMFDPLEPTLYKREPNLQGWRKTDVH